MYALKKISLFFVSVMWLWTLGRGDMAVRVTRQLCHIFAQLPITVSCQHGHCHWHHRHGDRLLGLLGCYQGKQVPPSKRKSRKADWGFFFYKTYLKQGTCLSFYVWSPG